MASEVIILSSSPAKQLRTYKMSSSPTFPSPNEFLHKKAPVLRGGSRATPIPDNVCASFTSAASLLRKNSFDDTQGGDTIQPFQANMDVRSSISMDGTKANTKTRNATAADDNGGDGLVAKILRKTLTKRDEPVKDCIEEKKSRRSKTKKNEIVFDDAGNKIQKPLPKPRAKNAILDHDEKGNVVDKPPHKPSTKIAEIRGGEHKSFKQKGIRKPRAKKTEGETIAPGRKPRAKKRDVDSQVKLAKAQITKPITDPNSDKGVAELTESRSTSKHFSTTSIPIEHIVDYGLLPAIKRRTAWTPPSATSRPDIFDTSIVGEELDDDKIRSGIDLSDESSRRLPDLLSSFGFNNARSTSQKKLSYGVGTKKRKLIEMIRTSSSTLTSENALVQKAKVPKKKARTLTDLAISAYAPEDESDDNPAPILQYFSYQTTEQSTRHEFKVPPKPRPRSSARKSAKGEGTAQKPILLSPESALKQVGKQDFVFGTSSQLAREESPTFLRDIHAAMQASNEIDVDDPFLDSICVPAASTTTLDKGKAISSPKQSLWSAAARDTSGELLDIAMVDLVESPVPGKITLLATKEHTFPPTKVPSLPTTVYHSELNSGREENNDVWQDLNKIATTPQSSHHLSKTVGPVEAAIRNGILGSPTKSTKLLDMPPTSSHKSKLTDSASKSTNAPPKSSPHKKHAKDAVMPDFAGYTTAQLTKDIASYRFKPIKSRDQMIALLEKCWESKQRMALAALGINPIKKSSQDEEPKSMKEQSLPHSQIEGSFSKGLRGRPKADGTALLPPKQKTKSKTKSANAVEALDLDHARSLSQIRTPQKSKRRGREASEDISDSDINMTPSPPRRRPSQIRTPPLPLQTSSATPVEDGHELSLNSSQIWLFKYITRAVTSVPPTDDPKNPSWHEKILLYDPIILEDLTIWLNTGALEKVGWDGEVEPKEVKKWCESKSVCCLWKENLRGGARSRY